ncbi:LPS export ABC transporter permease LptG [Sphingomonas sp. LM7]|uniref:LPS export ABC transporter permease LptG n=1 Tax=Sphingomonas sp. LM7 TaxID=1938607 RepID=UPI000983C18C|nr:LPS export ABC transporter permease LptG [Sphingomonas sp. LM7]AQR73484.1 LPS export ABC transporter permease LptG [Sphingomonas sp. LM7]
MNLVNFFPSRTMSLYMGKMFLVRTFAILAGLVLILQSLDLLSESGKIMAYAGNGDAEVLRYVGLRTPQIIATFLPFAVLLGTILALSQLNQNSEVIAMKASGLSAHQVLAPLLLTAFGVAALSFAFNDRIVARATSTLEQWKKVDYGPLPIDRGDRSNVWVKDGDNLIVVDQIRGKGDAAQLYNVTVYERTGQSLRGIITAKHGARDGQGWRIDGVQRFDVGAGTILPLPPRRIADGVRPDQFTLSHINADGLSFGALSEVIDDLKLAGRPTKALEGSLWHKLSGPLSSVLMPLLGAVAAFGIARSGKLFVRAVMGMALGFLFFVADNFALAMGNLGAYPPFLAAWAPFLLFLMIGEAVLLRTEE